MKGSELATHLFLGAFSLGLSLSHHFTYFTLLSILLTWMITMMWLFLYHLFVDSFYWIFFLWSFDDGVVISDLIFHLIWNINTIFFPTLSTNTFSLSQWAYRMRGTFRWFQRGYIDFAWITIKTGKQMDCWSKWYANKLNVISRFTVVKFWSLMKNSFISYFFSCANAFQGKKTDFCGLLMLNLIKKKFDW